MLAIDRNKNFFSAYRWIYGFLLGSLCLPIIASFLDSKPVTYVSFAGLLCLFLLLLPFIRVRSPKLLFGVIVLAFGTAAFSFASGRGIGVGGGLILLVEILVLYNLIINCPRFEPERYFRMISGIYSVIFVLLVVETVLIFVGFQDFFVSLIGHAEAVTKYKDYNTAGILLSLFQINGPNSIILGSQSASQLAALFAFWVFFRSHDWSGNYRYMVLALLLLFYAVVATMTANLLCIGMMFLLWYWRVGLFASGSSRLTLVLLVVPVIWVIFPLLAFRINNANDIQIYLSTILLPAEAIASMSFDQHLLGFGRGDSTDVYVNSDFGIAAIYFKAGAVYTIAFAVLLIGLFRKFSGIAIAQSRDSDIARELLQSSSRWMSAGAFGNIALGLAWAASLLHYTPAIEIGGRELFAFHLALALALLTNRNKPRQAPATVLQQQ